MNSHTAMLYHLFNGDYVIFPKTVPLKFYQYIPTITQSCAFYFRNQYYDFHKYHSQIMDVTGTYPKLFEYGCKLLPRNNNPIIDLFPRTINKIIREIYSSFKKLSRHNYSTIDTWLNGNTLIVHGEYCFFSSSFLNYIANKVPSYAWVCWGNTNIVYEKQYFDFINNARCIICLTKSDSEVFKRFFPNVKTIICPYIEDSLVFGTNKISSNKILIGNSGGFLEDYESLFFILAKENLDATFMIPYGNSKKNLNKFKALAEHELKNISFWEDIVSMEEYKTRLSEYKVYVCPATRQTGLGAIYNSISQGVKVYVNGVNYNWLKTLGFIVYSIDELQVSCNHEILEFSEEDRDFNIQHAKKIFGVHNMASKWESIFNILLDNE